MRYIILNLVALLFITGVNAAESFVYTGSVQEHSGGAGIIQINSQLYSVDFDTIIHGSANGGELGPKFKSGQQLGYNIELGNDDLPHITEIWILN